MQLLLLLLLFSFQNTGLVQKPAYRGGETHEEWQERAGGGGAVKTQEVATVFLFLPETAHHPPDVRTRHRGKYSVFCYFGPVAYLPL